MARPAKPVPSYRLHKQSGQAVVTIRTPDGRRKDVLLGKYNSAESLEEYTRLVAQLRVGMPVGPPAPELTVNEVLLRFWEFAQKHYRRPDGTPTSEVYEYRVVIRTLRGLYGTTPASDFGPLALRAVRQEFVAHGLTRKTINKRAGRIRRLFKWAAGRELVPADVYRSLSAVEGLQKGRTEAPDRDPVAPVEDWAVRHTLPHLSPVVAAMVVVQRLTGMRPGKVRTLRPADINRTGDAWLYRPGHHKMAYRGRGRAVVIGPKAQAILREFWPASPTDYFFSPARAVAAHIAGRSVRRVTPMYPSHARRNGTRRAKSPTRPPADHYTKDSYNRAVARAVGKANRTRWPLPEGHYGPELPVVPRWKPNQLRHAYATEVRTRFALGLGQAPLHGQPVPRRGRVLSRLRL
jgi:integrase